MPYLLLIETSTTLCSVGICKDGELLFSQELNDVYAHAENLGKFIEQCLERADITTSDLGAIAIGSGPGSYTGLRIGVSTAKGLAYATGVPLIAVSTMETMAAQPELAGFDGLLVPMIDARRMEVYTAVFNAAGERIKQTEALILDESSFGDYLAEEKMAFIGDGAAKFEALIGEHPNASFFPGVYPSVAGMVANATLAYQKRQFEDVAYYEPFYLKDFVATTPKKRV